MGEGRWSELGSSEQWMRCSCPTPQVRCLWALPYLASLPWAGQPPGQTVPSLSRLSLGKQRDAFQLYPSQVGPTSVGRQPCRLGTVFSVGVSPISEASPLHVLTACAGAGLCWLRVSQFHCLGRTCGHSRPSRAGASPSASSPTPLPAPSCSRDPRLRPASLMHGPGVFWSNQRSL